MDKKSQIEAIAGHPLTTIVLNAAPIVAAMVNPLVTPVIALLPVLAQTLAAERQSNRLTACLEELNAKIEALRIDLSQLTDDQYKLAGECATHMLSTINQEKLYYLRHAILNGLKDASIASGQSEALSRLIRDISAAETKLVLELFKFDGIFVTEKELEAPPPNTYSVPVGSPEELHIGGLIRLGLLHAHAPSWDVTRYGWSPITAKYIALVSAP